MFTRFRPKIKIYDCTRRHSLPLGFSAKSNQQEHQRLLSACFMIEHACVPATVVKRLFEGVLWKGNCSAVNLDPHVHPHIRVKKDNSFGIFRKRARRLRCGNS